ncbi:MAG TPA: hypothetical protein VJ904_01745, partial [Tichowtungia sp.]|nr:hypothetical protein [Tichowtungia sp.]
MIEYGKVTTFNANRPHGFGALDPETFAPYPKNPVIGAFFREIDRADELGSGMRNMVRYGKTYGGTDPQLIEGDEFKMIISVPEFEEQVAGKGSPIEPVETPVEKLVETPVKNGGPIGGPISGPISGPIVLTERQRQV